jgi:hypothetical protein
MAGEQQGLDLGGAPAPRDCGAKQPAVEWELIDEGYWQVQCGAVRLTIVKQKRGYQWGVHWRQNLLSGKADSEAEAKECAVSVARKLLRESGELLDALEATNG